MAEAWQNKSPFHLQSHTKIPNSNTLSNYRTNTSHLLLIASTMKAKFWQRVSYHLCKARKISRIYKAGT